MEIVSTKDIVLLGLGAFLGALCSWLITHIYHVKNLKMQDQAFAIERKALQQALEVKNATDKALLMSKYIDSAVTEWKKHGTPVHYIDSIVNIPKEQKAEIYRAASRRHNRSEPKNNPYL